jgi:hypothetical protein
MSETRINHPDLIWLRLFVENYEYVLKAYPELFSKEDEDDLKVVKQIIKEKIDEIKKG